jgi:hypothetical protein
VLVSKGRVRMYQWPATRVTHRSSSDPAGGGIVWTQICNVDYSFMCSRHDSVESTFQCTFPPNSGVKTVRCWYNGYTRHTDTVTGKYED